MTREEAKSELMQIYMSLSEEKKQALDVLMAQADVTDDDIATMGILFNTDIECLCNQGRFNDAKEMEQIRDRLKGRLQADGEKNCFNCKWYPDNDITKGFDEVCHKCSNSDKWEDIAQADGEYISRQAVLDITWEEPSYTDALNVLTEVRDKIKALPSVKPQEPKKEKYDNRWFNGYAN